MDGRGTPLSRTFPKVPGINAQPMTHDASIGHTPARISPTAVAVQATAVPTGWLEGRLDFITTLGEAGAAARATGHDPMRASTVARTAQHLPKRGRSAGLEISRVSLSRWRRIMSPFLLQAAVP